MNIIDIAKIAGVSSATVSRVINKSGYVKEETRKKVEAAIAGNHYVPNAVARSLSSKNSSAVGIIIPDITNEFFPNLFVGMNDIAEKNNLNVLFFDTGEKIEKEHEYLEVVQSQQIKGLIIAPVSCTDTKTRETLQRLESTGIPVVLVDRNVDGASFSGVFVNSKLGAYEGMTALIREGHKKIAIITGPSDSLPGKERYEGYCKALSDHGLTYREEYVVRGDFKIDKAYQQTKMLLELNDRPTAIFTSNNLTTLGCLKYITDKKLVLGKDISILGFDDITSLKIIDYKLSVIARDEREQGRKAMKLLIERLSNKKTKEAKVIYIPHKLILRGSETYDW